MFIRERWAGFFYGLGWGFVISAIIATISYSLDKVSGGFLIAAAISLFLGMIIDNTFDLKDK